MILNSLFILSYFLILGFVIFKTRSSKDSTESDFLLSGRKLTLPAFIATLASTWYGGVFGVGEYTVLFGISQWVVFGLPYYIFAIIFAFFLAGKIRETKITSIPEGIKQKYGQIPSDLASLFVFLLVNPAPYLLAVATLLGFVFGVPNLVLLLAVLIGSFSAVYVSSGGLNSVVQTDKIQLVLMYSGFALLLIFSIFEFGPITNMVASLDPIMLDPLGGQTIQYILVWFFIASWTLVDPGFHQRVAATKDINTAKKGILYSTLAWAVFDFLTLFTGLYGVVYLENLDNASLVYLILGEQVLPSFLNSLFLVGVLATIMSTLDSYLFLSGQTLGRDFMQRFFPKTSTIKLTRFGIAISLLLAIILSYLAPSIISLWYVIGTICIPALILPVIGVYIKQFEMNSFFVSIYIISTFLVSFVWLMMGDIFTFTSFLGVEPFYPGMLTGIIIFLIYKISKISFFNTKSD
jgi:SSS family solute:Na+ symporter